jgi:D-threonate/D-erythronate kinase
VDPVPSIPAAVLADDTTGALEMGALLAEARISSVVVWQWPPALPPPCGELALPLVPVLDARSRHLSAEAAFERLLPVALDLYRAELPLIYKKTDSTLRGNLAAEFRALQQGLPGRPIVFIPAYPEFGRTVLEGRLLVNGVPLAETEFSRDVRTPIAESLIPALLEAGGLTHVRAVAGAAELERILPQADPRDVLVCDASTHAHRSAITGVLAIQHRLVIAAGAGGWFRHWRHLVRAAARRTSLNLPSLGAGPIAGAFEIPREWILVCGSRHPASLRQAQKAREHGLQVLQPPTQTQASPEEVAHQLAARVKDVVSQRAISSLGCIIFGGDTVAAVLDALECRGVIPAGECLPGVPLGAALSPAGPLALITKAGGFGSDEIVAAILDALSRYPQLYLQEALWCSSE